MKKQANAPVNASIKCTQMAATEVNVLVQNRGAFLIENGPPACGQNATLSICSQHSEAHLVVKVSM